MEKLLAISLNENRYTHDIFGKELIEYIEGVLISAGMKNKDIIRLQDTSNVMTLAKLDNEHDISYNYRNILIATNLCTIIRPEKMFEKYEEHMQKDSTITIINTKCGKPAFMFIKTNEILNDSIKNENIFTLFRNLLNIYDDGSISAKNNIHFYSSSELFYVDNPRSLTKTVSLIKEYINEYHMENGVIFIDPSTTYVSLGVKIGVGTVIEPMVKILGETVIGDNCTIGSFSSIEDSIIGNNSKIASTRMEKATVGQNCNVGPYAYLRPNTVLKNDVKIGDFVEVKNSVIGNGTKASHLTYIGDSDVGENVNFGCGTVTVNYDGKNKFRTTIEDNAFIGCNTNIVSPVTIGNSAFTAAGSTITKDVPAKNLGIARNKQVNKDGWVK